MTVSPFLRIRKIALLCGKEAKAIISFYYRFLFKNIAIIVANIITKANISLYVTNIQ